MSEVVLVDQILFTSEDRLESIRGLLPRYEDNTRLCGDLCNLLFEFDSNSCTLEAYIDYLLSKECTRTEMYILRGIVFGMTRVMLCFLLRLDYATALWSRNTGILVYGQGYNSMYYDGQTEIDELNKLILDCISSNESDWWNKCEDKEVSGVLECIKVRAGALRNTGNTLIPLFIELRRNMSYLLAVSSGIDSASDYTKNLNDWVSFISHTSESAEEMTMVLLNLGIALQCLSNRC